MPKRVHVFTKLVLAFVDHAFRIREVILSLILLILLGGFLVSSVEGLSLGDSIYFAFITALSVGYGDICPTTILGRLLSVAIGVVGMVTVGMTVAIANRALAEIVTQEELDKQ